MKMSGKRKSVHPTLAAFGFTKKIKFSGKIKSFNEKICRYCVFYKDESIDLMGISDIDGVHIILI